ncbi:hypothetical protein [Paraburkholderia sp.]|uniref:hypothetical protein n=1 Tax=Paraburkholderia sp. TaxID=1926495 RepID=UPI0023838AD8|nr:hypothetical protein [Paraburkholderia sp.]MDE1184074.1 hypothetical protein [Paraburkholderia sp.]
MHNLLEKQSLRAARRLLMAGTAKSQPEHGVHVMAQFTEIAVFHYEIPAKAVRNTNLSER